MPFYNVTSNYYNCVIDEKMESLKSWSAYKFKYYLHSNLNGIIILSTV